MVLVRVQDLGLTYRYRDKPTLARRPARPAGRIAANGRTRYVTALEGLSFELIAGDRLGLIGPNGAGKTTLLRVLYGIYEPTCGAVDIEGRVDALFNLNLGFRPWATGRRNIELRGLINGWSHAEIAERMEDIIAFSELGDFIDMPMQLYSQGMSARLAFAIATSFQPEILLMDEWIGAGDADFQRKARERLKAMLQTAGIIVLASHNAAILRATCSLGLVLEAGRLAFLGPIEEALKFHARARAGK